MTNEAIGIPHCLKGTSNTALQCTQHVHASFADESWETNVKPVDDVTPMQSDEINKCIDENGKNFGVRIMKHSCEHFGNALQLHWTSYTTHAHNGLYEHQSVSVLNAYEFIILSIIPYCIYMHCDYCQLYLLASASHHAAVPMCKVLTSVVCTSSSQDIALTKKHHTPSQSVSQPPNQLAQISQHGASAVLRNFISQALLKLPSSVSWPSHWSGWVRDTFL